MVENQRIEYKEGWNPESILHTVCAFANDYDNLYGGYLIIGIKDDNGRPSPDSPGVPPDKADKMAKDLLNLVNMIEPGYEVSSAYEDYRGIGVFVIWAPGGPDRPYKCPVSPGKNEKAKGFFIRKQSGTVKANPMQEKELFRMSETTPYDDRINYRSSMEDLDRVLISRYLENTNSRSALKYMDGKSTEELAADLRICSKVPEMMKPLNVGLLFFSRKPSDFFSRAYVEVTIYPVSAGNRLISKRFDGPLNDQITDTVSFLKTNVITKYTGKVPGRTEAETAYNYPAEAVREVIVNAVLHKDYSVPEPVTVGVYPDRIEVTSIPGPDRSIPDIDIKNGSMRSRIYRNRRIGDFLERLGLAEVKNTGMITIAGSMSENGSPEAVFMTDEARTYLTVVLPVHKAFLGADKVSGKRTTEQITKEVLAIIDAEGEIGLRDLAEKMGYVSVPSSLKNAVSVLRASGVLEYTEAKPNSPNQKIRKRKTGSARTEP